MVNENDLSILHRGEGAQYISDEIKEQIAWLHEQAYERQGVLNSNLSVDQILDVKSLNYKAEKLIKKASGKLSLSMRSQQRLLRLALTISDWDKQDEITDRNISEAMSYRAYDLLKASTT